MKYYGISLTLLRTHSMHTRSQRLREREDVVYKRSSADLRYTVCIHAVSDCVSERMWCTREVLQIYDRGEGGQCVIFVPGGQK